MYGTLLGYATSTAVEGFTFSLFSFFPLKALSSVVLYHTSTPGIRLRNRKPDMGGGLPTRTVKPKVTGVLR